ncbi:MAG: C4-type zinc ribbon domain-containing protein [Acidobacteriota bacterium]
MNPELEKLIALHELDLNIQQLQASITETTVGHRQITEQMQKISANCQQAKAQLENADKDEIQTQTEISQLEIEIGTYINKLDVLAEKIKEHDEQLKVLTDSREKMINSLSESLVWNYERIRSRNGGIAMAVVISNCCQKCHLMVRYQVLKKVRKAEQITVCENCGRILYCKPVQTAQSTNTNSQSLTNDEQSKRLSHIYK